MNPFIGKLSGMSSLTDQVIATDMLIAAKSAIKQYALAITETATPEIRSTLTQHLEDCINFHKQISDYMVNKGYYFPLDTSKQVQVDTDMADQALKLQPTGDQ
ncbi:spore coat protein [Ectobacillus funiculus]|uniref:spore coat protein n=1 Tax=Ectobacillus funiculus TaxID=137993 RepID=UPI00397C9787